MDPRSAELPRNKLRVKPKFPEICPCGCKVADMDEKGYCRHIVGFTLDRKTVELREQFGASFERVGVQKRPVDPAKDIIVEMETMTARVYQTLGDPMVTKVASTKDTDAMMEMLQEALAEIAALKKQVAEQAATQELALA